MAGNWRKRVSKAAISEDREDLLKLLQESVEPKTVRNLCVRLFGPYKYQKKWKHPLTFEDAVVEGSMSLMDIAAANGWVDVCEELVTKHGCTHESSTVTEILETASWCKKGYEHLQRSPLSYAVKEGHVDVVAYLVRVFKLQISGDKGRAFLTFAIINNQLEMVKYFVSVCEIDASKLSRLAGMILLGKEFYKYGNLDKVSPFIIACVQCCAEIIKYLVTEGHCDPKEECNWICRGYKISPGIAVAFKGNLELLQYVVNICDVYCFECDYWYSVPSTCVLRDSEVIIRFLIEHATIKNLKQSDAAQLLMMSSASSGLTDCVQYLHVNHGIHIGGNFNMYNIPYVNEAARNGYIAVVAYLLEECAFSEHKLLRVSPFTMYAAASSGHLPLIKYLMEEQSDFIALKGHHDWQRVVLHVAAGCGHLDIVKHLIAAYNLTLIESDNFIKKTEFLSLKAITTRNRNPSSDGGILHVAAARGHLNIVDYLIDKCNHDPNQTNSFSQTPLHFAAFNGHLPVVEHLLRTSSRVSHDEDGNTPLHFACRQGHLRIVKCLIEQCKLDPTTTNRLSQSPLCLAVQRGHLLVVEYLADRVPSVDPEAPIDDKRNTVLHFAACGGHINMVAYVINRWITNPNKSNEDAQTPLHVAISAGYMHIAEYFIKEFPRVVTCTDTSVDKKGNTALHIAVEHGSLSTVHYLINECKLNPNQINGIVLTPLHVAICGGKMHIAEYLIKEFPGVVTCKDTPVDKRGNTALHIAVEHGSLSTVHYLINECKLNPNQINGIALTPLHFAICGGKKHVAEYLIKEFPGVVTCKDTPVDKRGNTALHIAVIHGSSSITKYLVNECKFSPYKTNFFSETPLYLAVCNGHLPVVKYLFCECPSVIPDTHVDDQGNTALHIAVQHGSLSMIKYLVNECKLSPNRTNRKSLTPLHVACSLGKIGVAEYLFKEFPGVVTCTDTSVDKKGNTALHIAVEHGSLSTIKCLINQCKLSPYKNNNSSKTPLFLAVCNGHLPVIKFLFSECSGVIPDRPVDHQRNTALHIAVQRGSLNIIDYLVNECKLNPNSTNGNSLTPLHVACSLGNMPVAEYFIKEFPGIVTCTDTSVDERGNTALHIAVEHGSLSTIKYLVNGCDLDPYKNNNLSVTPLYLAVYNRLLPVVKFLYSECPSVIPEAPVDDKGNTALHIIAEYGEVNLVRYLTKECNLDPKQPNHALSTSLHLAVANNHLPVVRFLLDERLCHASSVNYHKCLRSANRETSLVLITEYDVKGYLSSFGARSTFDQNDEFLRGIKSSFPVHSFTKVFLLGDPAAGKSTLAKNFRDLATSFIPHFFGQVSGVESRTAGIIPVTIQSRQLGNVVLYDLAGHPEFYSSHMAVLHKLMQECPAVFICVIDLRKSDKELLKEVRFWFNFIKMGSAADNVRADSQVVVAGSHADLLSSDVYSQKQRLVESVSRKFLVQSFAGLATLDCRKVSSTGLASLIRLILQAQETIRKKVCNAKESIPIFCHMLMKFLNNIKGKDDKINVYSLTDLSQLIRNENQRVDREGILVSIPSDSTELHHFLSFLNDRGLVLYLRGSTDEDSWIVVDENTLLSKVIGVLFAPEGFKEHCCIASSTGIATSSYITGLFPKIPPQVVIGMLKSLEFCHVIDPSHMRISNLSLEHSQGDFSLREGENLLFFPSHISTERPNKLHRIFQFCWYLVCQDPHQFFPIRFLHVLLLNLESFSFMKHCSRSFQVLVDEDLCTVWKNGIRWMNKNGIETVVEVLERCTIVQLVTTCPEGMLVEHCRHRSTLIREILALKQELCHSIEVQEKFLLPSLCQTLQYPLPPLSKLSLLNINFVAQCAVQNSKCSLFTDSFDPYRNLGASLIQSLFTKGDNKVSELDLFEIAERFRLDFQTHEYGCDVLGISPRELENRLSELPSQERQNPVRVCEELFLKWKAHDADGGTYESLKCRFDMFSVFAGRNPLDLAEIEQPSLPVLLHESQQSSQPCK